MLAQGNDVFDGCPPLHPPRPPSQMSTRALFACACRLARDCHFAEASAATTPLFDVFGLGWIGRGEGEGGSVEMTKPPQAAFAAQRISASRQQKSGNGVLCQLPHGVPLGCSNVWQPQAALPRLS